MSKFANYDGRLHRIVAEEKELQTVIGGRVFSPSNANPLLKIVACKIVEGDLCDDGDPFPVMQSDTQPAKNPTRKDVAPIIRVGDMVTTGSLRGRVEALFTQAPDIDEGGDYIKVRLYQKKSFGWATTDKTVTVALNEVTKLREPARSKQSHNFSAKAGVLNLYGDIGDSYLSDGITVKMVGEALKDIGDVTSIRVHINSPGGDVFEGYAIYNILKRQEVPVNVVIDGIAASSAANIAQAGDTITMPRASQFMIHRGFTFAGGNKNDLQEKVDLLERVDNQIADIHAVRSGKTREEILDLMDAETWFNGEEALEAGLITDASEDLPIAASMNRSWIQNAPSMNMQEYRARLIARSQRIADINARLSVAT